MDRGAVTRCGSAGAGRLRTVGGANWEACALRLAEPRPKRIAGLDRVTVLKGRRERTATGHMRYIDLMRFSAGGLKGHRLRTSLSLLGVAIGVGSVILLTSLGEGARRYIAGEFASLGSNLLIIVPGKTETAGLAPLVSTAPHDLTRADADALASLS